MEEVPSSKLTDVISNEGRRVTVLMSELKALEVVPIQLEEPHFILGIH